MVQCSETPGELYLGLYKVTMTTIISLMACYRVGRRGRGGQRGGWEAGGGLNPPLGLFGLAILFT